MKINHAGYFLKQFHFTAHCEMLVVVTVVKIALDSTNQSKSTFKVPQLKKDQENQVCKITQACNNNQFACSCTR